MVNKDWDICGCGVSAFDGKEGVALVCQVEEGKNPCNHVMHFGCTAHKVEAFMQGEPLTCPACQQSVLLYHRLDGSGNCCIVNHDVKDRFSYHSLFQVLSKCNSLYQKVRIVHYSFIYGSISKK